MFNVIKSSLGAIIFLLGSLIFSTGFFLSVAGYSYGKYFLLSAVIVIAIIPVFRTISYSIKKFIKKTK